MKAVIFGATSEIAQKTIRKLLDNNESSKNCHLVLVGRDEIKLEAVKKDLEVRSGCVVEVLVFDLSKHSEIERIVNKCWDSLSGIDIALLAHGVLPNQLNIEDSWNAILDTLDTNMLSYFSIMTALSIRMQNNKSGKIVVLGSVAGDRGKKSNYIYGAAKGGISIYAQGLRNQLSGSGVSIITVKPGLVDTPMTQDFEKGGLLWASSDKVASDIVKAIENNREVIYTPWFWRFIMLIINLIPESMFKKMSL